ncbi:hypothetical protein HRbin28_02725 [bacterium HR28]|nr:hypothetical protein HRbin28_02725 [bacterium HR28]
MLSLVDVHPAQDKRKGADRGIDGYLCLFDDGSGQRKKVVVQVKSSEVSVLHVRDLRGTVEREGAALGILVML